MKPRRTTRVMARLARYAAPGACSRFDVWVLDARSGKYTRGTDLVSLTREQMVELVARRFEDWRDDPERNVFPVVVEYVDAQGRHQDEAS